MTLYVTSSTPSSGVNCTVTSACHKQKQRGKDRPVRFGGGEVLHMRVILNMYDIPTNKNA